MSTQAGLVTVEEFLRLTPAKEGHYELHHGEVVFVPPTKMGHQRVQLRLQKLLMILLEGRGNVMAEMAFQPSRNYEVWSANVAFLSAERDAGVADGEYLQGAPDLVAEVLSPSNSMEEMNDRMAICLENGCSSFWVVDAKRKMVSVTEGKIIRHYGPGDSIACCLLDTPVPVSQIFE